MPFSKGSMNISCAAAVILCASSKMNAFEEDIKRRACEFVAQEVGHEVQLAAFTRIKHTDVTTSETVQQDVD